MVVLSKDNFEIYSDELIGSILRFDMCYFRLQIPHSYGAKARLRSPVVVQP